MDGDVQSLSIRLNSPLEFVFRVSPPILPARYRLPFNQDNLHTRRMQHSTLFHLHTQQYQKIPCGDFSLLLSLRTMHHWSFSAVQTAQTVIYKIFRILEENWTRQFRFPQTTCSIFRGIFRSPCVRVGVLRAVESEKLHGVFAVPVLPRCVYIVAPFSEYFCSCFYVGICPGIATL